MTQEEFEKTVRARWPDAVIGRDMVSAIVQAGAHSLAVQVLSWVTAPEWGIIMHGRHAFADTLEQAILALEVEIVKEVQDRVADANTLLAITSPGSTVEIVVKRPGDGK